MERAEGAFWRRARAQASGRRYTLNVGGQARTYVVHRPPQYDGTAETPLVLYLHGGGGNARSAYLDRMDETANRHGFLLAIPEGVGPRRGGQLRASWNGGAWATGRCCGDADDVAFITAMLGTLQRMFRIDPRRIYAAGISNGGLMTNRLGCELADTIAAIVTVAPAGIPEHCAPARPLPVMDIHGTADTCNPFEGGAPTNPLCRAVDYVRMPPRDVVRAWLSLNRCESDSELVYERGGARCLRYARCQARAEVVFCAVDGMGHAWPSGFASRVLGIYPVSRDISGDQLWDFFSRHALPAS